VTHDSRVFEYGDRVIEMADGRIVSVTDGSSANSH
jgi:ABC-type lipoprotein export system ATPase subunit